MEAIKDLYNIYLNYYGAEDSKEVSDAREKLEKCLGENYTKEVEDVAGDLGYFSNEQGFVEGFRYAASLLTNTHSSSSAGSLEDLMRNEYDAMAFMDTPMPQSYKNVSAFIKEKLSKSDFLKIEEELIKICTDSEKFGFEQGFMRGITVTKGGAI